MQYVGDAVMAVFGAPVATDDHADRALAAALAMHRGAGRASTRNGSPKGCTPFGLGIGLSTGTVAAALLGSEERVEYTLVGDAVNLCQRLQQFAEPGQTVLSEPTWNALTDATGPTSSSSTRSSSRVATHPLSRTVCRSRATDLATDRSVVMTDTVPA